MSNNFMNMDTEELNYFRIKAAKRDRVIGIVVSCLGGCLILAWILAITIPMIGNPMRRPNPMPTNYVLNLTPPGTHIDDVVSIVGGHRDWNIARINREQGFVHPMPHTIRPRSEGWPVIIGDKSIRVDPGYYRFGLLTRTAVAIYYGFDADGYLVEVFVRRSSAS